MVLSTSFAVIAFCATVYAVVYYYLRTRHRERMALIEAGLDPVTFDRSSRLPQFLLMLGILMMGIAFAMGTGTLLQAISGYAFKDYPQLYLIAFPFFLALSLLICARMLNKNK